MKEKIKKEYLRRLRLILGTQLSAKNKVQAINSLAVPVPQYSFGIVNWRELENEQLDTKNQVALTSYNFHHPKVMIERY